MTLATMDKDARAVGLALRGALHPTPDATLPEGTQSLVLLGPDEPGFWPLFQSSEEARDGENDPLDRWSKRVVGDLATAWGGTPVFPSDGPPYPPFLKWALESGYCWESPVGLLVHKNAGLFISFRGAIAVSESVVMSTAPVSPCPSCAQPCLNACPVGALSANHDYDVRRCQAHVASPEGLACRDGCLVRKACPVATDFRRKPEQSAFHMKAFMQNYRP